MFRLLPVIVPALLGVSVVIQTGLNRKIATHWGLPAATFLNSLVLIIAAGVLLLAAVLRPAWFSAPGFQVRFDWTVAALWFVVPGILGLFLVAGAPWSVSRSGAVVTFILLVSAQLAASALWDLKVEHIAVPWQRWVGISLAWVGVLLATLKF